MEDFIGKYNGGQIESRLDKVKDMVGATASQAGEGGLVPAPAKGDEDGFLARFVNDVESRFKMIVRWFSNDEKVY